MARSLFPSAFAFLIFIFLLVTGVIKSVPSQEEVIRVLSFPQSAPPQHEVKLIFVEPEGPGDIFDVDCEKVKPYVYTRAVSLASLPPRERKEKFIDMLLPSVLVVNYEITQMRERLLRIREKKEKGQSLSAREEKLVKWALERCRSKSLEEVLKKMFPVPPSIVIAQGAIESGWGTSRFFLEANNPFGIWTFKPSSEAVKAKEGKAYLRRFDTLLDAVREYMYNVNVGWAYRKFREGRLKTSDPYKLSGYLTLYSIERETYVRKLRKIIKDNHLDRLDLCSLDPDYIR